MVVERLGHHSQCHVRFQSIIAANPLLTEMNTKMNALSPEMISFRVFRRSGQPITPSRDVLLTTYCTAHGQSSTPCFGLMIASFLGTQPRNQPTGISALCNTITPHGKYRCEDFTSKPLGQTPRSGLVAALKYRPSVSTPNVRAQRLICIKILLRQYDINKLL